jgi:ABC-type transport system involved in cytochrome c biogenesis permease subunit
VHLSLVTEQQLVSVAVVLLALATVVQVPLIGGRRVPHWQTSAALGGVALILALAIAGRWVRESQGPFLTLYDVLLSNVFSLTLLFLLVVWRVPATRVAALLACPLLLLLGLWLANVSAVAVPLPATFDNYWLWLHVLSGKFFLGLCMASACAAGVLLISRWRKGSGLARVISDTSNLEEAVWALFFLAFVFHSFMLLAGSVWAHSAWGRYWSWDPLETWTLITWLMLGGVLHARSTFANMPKWLAQALIMVVFAIAFMTFFGVPFISQAPHKGVM